MPEIELDPLRAGNARGPLLVLDEPLSFWGGVDYGSGEIIDVHHPQLGQNVSGRIVVMPSGRGSSSSSSVFVELIRRGKAPAAVVLSEPDAILVIGAIAAEMLYGTRVPFYRLAPDHIADLTSGVEASIDRDRLIT